MSIVFQDWSVENGLMSSDTGFYYGVVLTYNLDWKKSKSAAEYHFSAT